MVWSPCGKMDAGELGVRKGVIRSCSQYTNKTYMYMYSICISVLRTWTYYHKRKRWVRSRSCLPKTRTEDSLFPLKTSSGTPGSHGVICYIYLSHRSTRNSYSCNSSLPSLPPLSLRVGYVRHRKPTRELQRKAKPEPELKSHVDHWLHYIKGRELLCQNEK
jgi:hypothetical protein